tara:strand:+ start:336 stop:1793 length:1458 start_codon:yes stop_codon:yes gene_type:complete
VAKKKRKFKKKKMAHATRQKAWRGAAPRLNALIAFVDSEAGLARFRAAFCENMEYKKLRYESLASEAERECQEQLRTLRVRVEDMKVAAGVVGEQDNWAIFESVSGGYRDAIERRAKFETLAHAASERHQEVLRNTRCLRKDFVGSLAALAVHEAQTHIVERVADLIASFLKDPALFRMKPLNIMFVGSPGSGKTTLSSCIGRAFARAGIFVGDRLIEAGRAELVAQYEGQTVARTRSFLMHHLDGGVIFVDEAYAITPWSDGKPEGYGSEAAAAMVEFMTRFQGLYCLIVAGYEREMTRYFLGANEGLRRRFPYKFVLRDLDCNELLHIFKRQLLIQQGRSELYQATDATRAGAVDLYEGESYFTADAWKYLKTVLKHATDGFPTYVDEYDAATKMTYHHARRFQPQHPRLFAIFRHQAAAMTTLAEEALQVLVALVPLHRPTADGWTLGTHGRDVMAEIIEQRIRNSELSAAELTLRELRMFS